MTITSVLVLRTCQCLRLWLALVNVRDALFSRCSEGSHLQSFVKTSQKFVQFSCEATSIENNYVSSREPISRETIAHQVQNRFCRMYSAYVRWIFYSQERLRFCFMVSQLNSNLKLITRSVGNFRMLGSHSCHDICDVIVKVVDGTIG